MMETYYKPSGKISPVFFPCFVLLHALAIPIVSVAYICIIYYIPYIYLNILVAVGCGAAMGVVMNFAVKFGKVRNIWFAVLFGLLALLMMKYVQWCVYVPIVFADTYEFYALTVPEKFKMSLELITSPSQLLDHARLIYEYGVWELNGTQVKGVFSLIVWVSEFACMAVPSYLIFRKRLKFPFCEDEGEWYEKEQGTVEIRIPEDFDSIKNDMERGDFGRLVKLAGENRPDYLRFLTLTFYKSQSLERYYLEIDKVTVTYQNAKQKRNITKQLGPILIDPESVMAIRAAYFTGVDYTAVQNDEPNES